MELVSIHFVGFDTPSATQPKPQPKGFRNAHSADVQATWADITRARELLSWRPLVSLEEGIP